MTTITYALVGALVASRHPRNPVGWIFCIEGVLLGLTTLASSYQTMSHLSEVSLPGVEIALWLNMWVYSLSIV